MCFAFGFFLRGHHLPRPPSHVLKELRPTLFFFCLPSTSTSSTPSYQQLGVHPYVAGWLGVCAKQNSNLDFAPHAAHNLQRAGTAYRRRLRESTDCPPKDKGYLPEFEDSFNFPILHTTRATHQLAHEHQHVKKFTHSHLHIH